MRGLLPNHFDKEILTRGCEEPPWFSDQLCFIRYIGPRFFNLCGGLLKPCAEPATDINGIRGISMAIHIPSSLLCVHNCSIVLAWILTA